MPPDDGSAIHWQAVRTQGHTGLELAPDSALCVTVPGAAALWEDTVKNFGTLDLKQAWPQSIIISLCIRTASCLPIHSNTKY